MTPPISKEKPDFRKQAHDLPHKPGVYLMRDRFNRVIYVGKARDLHKRVGSYFMPSRQMSADPKTRALIDSIWAFEVHTVKSEPEALLLEGKLIKEFRPKYNISFRDDKHFLMVKVDVIEPWPRFRLTRNKKEDGARYFGPFVHSGALRKTLTFLRKKFGVLTFGRGTPTERELKSSTYQVPMKLADISEAQYRDRVNQACEFLDGQSKEMLALLETEMREAAAKLDFEKAAELRNMLDDLRTTTKTMRRFTRHSLPSSIDPAADLLALADALQLSGPPQIMECFDISNISTTHIVASMVCFKAGVPDKTRYRRFRITTVKGQDDFASMAEVVRRRYTRLIGGGGDIIPDVLDTGKVLSSTLQRIPAQDIRNDVATKDVPTRLPDLIIVDGGKGQLNSACRELQRLGLSHLPIVGLAKEFEEIYRPGQALPFLLPEDSGALRLLQRIRDEAHRFANGYHQLLMKRRIGESILDDCPGVSEARKKVLLRQFGSVARIRKAGVDAIAATEGISRKLAEQITIFLAERK